MHGVPKQSLPSNPLQGTSSLPLRTKPLPGKMTVPLQNHTLQHHQARDHISACVLEGMVHSHPPLHHTCHRSLRDGPISVSVALNPQLSAFLLLSACSCFLERPFLPPDSRITSHTASKCPPSPQLSFFQPHLRFYLAFGTTRHKNWSTACLRFKPSEKNCCLGQPAPSRALGAFPLACLISHHLLR